MTGARFDTVVPLRRVGTLGLTATALLGVVAVMELVTTWAAGNEYEVYEEYSRLRTDALNSELDGAMEISRIVALCLGGSIVVAGLVFVVWLWRTRANAELISRARHRLSRGWIIGSWVCPVVCLWFPFMVVDDVNRASRPDNPTDLRELQSVPGGRAVRLWWSLVLGWTFLKAISFQIQYGAIHADELYVAVVLQAVAATCAVAAVTAAVVVVRTISRWQGDQDPAAADRRRSARPPERNF